MVSAAALSFSHSSSRADSGVALYMADVPTVMVRGSTLQGDGGAYFVTNNTVTVGDGDAAQPTVFRAGVAVVATPNSVKSNPAAYVGSWTAGASQNSASFTNAQFDQQSTQGVNLSSFMYDQGNYGPAGLFNDAANVSMRGGRADTTGNASPAIVSTDNSAGQQAYGPLLQVQPSPQGAARISTLGTGSHGVITNLGSQTTLTAALISTAGALANGVHTSDNDVLNPTLVLPTPRPTLTTIDGGTIQVAGAGASAVMLSNSPNSAANGLAKVVLKGALAISNTTADSRGIAVDGNASVVDGSALSGATINAGGMGVAMQQGLGQSVILANTSVSNGSGPLFFAGKTGSSAQPSSLQLNAVTASAAAGNNLLQAEGPSTLNASASASTLTGNVQAHKTDGTLVNLSLLNATTLTGTIDPVNVLIDASSQWVMTGASSVNDSANNGLVRFTLPATPPALTLTASGAMTGAGTYALNTQLGDSSSPSDRIVLDGASASASGSNLLSISNAAGSGALTSGNGILVVETRNGATTAPASFALAGPVSVVNGATLYSYSLHQVGQNWYLQSTAGPAPMPRPVPAMDSLGLLLLAGGLALLAWQRQRRAG